MMLVAPWLLLLLLGVLVHYSLAQRLWPSKWTLKNLLFQSIWLTLIYANFLLITQRAYFSLLLSIIILVIPLVINHAKYHALQEPLVFSDLYLYLQVFTHPRLFLPFLNLPITLSAIGIGLILLTTAIHLEKPLKINFLYINIICIGIIIAGFITVKYLAKIFTLSFAPNEDIRQVGFFNSLIISFFQAKRHRNQLNKLLHTEHFPDLAISNKEKLPHLIAIQSESFFDPRLLSTSIKTNILATFDKICRQACSYGRLSVPAWGANTLRSEFSFLTGIANHKLEHYRYNPYQFINHSIPSLISKLKKQGYYCIAIHPNHASFFKRDKVFPYLGFDEFIDINQFDTTKTAGPYISDQAVKDKLIEILQHPYQQPLFIFVITMENHGPLHLESYQEKDLPDLYQSTPPKHHADLTIYLKHLSNADRMLKELTSFLKQSEHETLLCWYGDHVPSMPYVYHELNFNDGRTDYFIWHNRNSSPSPFNQSPKNLDVHELGLLLYTLAFKVDEQTPHSLANENITADV